VTEPARKGIADSLRRMLVTAELAPGVVSEADLCRLLGCSRTPLREALRQLAHDHLVVLAPRKNVLIPQLGVLEFQQAHEAARFVEGVCVALAAVRIDAQQLEQMREIIARQRRANEAGSFYDLAELDCEFHVAIAKATANLHLFETATRLHGFFARFTFQAYKASGGAGQSIAEHTRIVEALHEGDVDLARQRLEEHTMRGGQRILAILGLGEEERQF
jgi:DNA-binding GntR family transcriptional regulator